MGIATLCRVSLAGVLVLSAAGSLSAQFSEDLTIPAPIGRSFEALPLEFRLQRADAEARAGRPHAEVRERLGLGRVRLREDGAVRVEVHGPTGESPALDAEAFSRLGGERIRAWRNVADGWVPVTELRSLARAIPAGYEVLSADDRIITTATEGNGPGLTNTAAYRDLGYDGSGIGVAIIDLGFKNLEISRGSGDVPIDIVKVDFTGGGFYANGDDDHGRFCAEVIHDHAPNADFYAIKIDSSAGLGAAVDYCIDEGVDIISMSLNFGLTSWDDDSGAACAAANAAATAGILFFTAAGNDGDKHYEGISTDGDNDNWVDIDPGDETLDMLVQPGKTVEFEVKWDKSGNTNFDIYLFSTDPGNWHDTGENNGELYEKVAWKNEGDENVTVHLAIHNVTGATVPIEVYGRGGTWQADLVPWGSTQSPSNSSHPSVISVGAVRANLYDTPPFTDDLIAASYSSRGLSNDGMMLPDLCAPTDISGSFFAVFNGTSAATPMAAGTAAVLWSVNPAATTPQTRTMLFIWSQQKDWSDPGQDPIYGTGGIHFPDYADCNQNGNADVFDINGGAADANDNWIPDLCEVVGYSYKMFAPAPVPDDDGIHTILGAYTTPPPGGLPPAATGFAVGIAHDPAVFSGVDVQVGPALESLNGGLGPDLFLVEVLPGGFTLETLFGSDPTGGPMEIPVLARQDFARLRYFVQPGVGAATPPTTIAFSDTLGSAAPVPNSVQTAAGPVSVSLIAPTPIQFVDPVRFRFSIDDAAATYDPADGAVTVGILAAIAEEIGSSAAATAVSGFTMAIAHDSTAIAPVGVEPAPLLDALGGGMGPSFFSATVGSDGIAVDVLYGAGETLLHDLGLAVIRVTYQAVSGALVGDLDGETVRLSFDDALGGSTTPNSVRVGAIPESPGRGEGWIELWPASAEPEFARGDCNADGGMDIGDPITVLGFLFPVGGSSTTPGCADACDGNDDGLLDIADAIRILGALFSAGAPPPAPFPGCGADPSADALDCAAFSGCP